MQTRLRRVVSGLSLASLTLAGCVPDLDSDEATVRAPRVLAVLAEPAEARPDQPVSYTAVLVDENGRRSNAALGWYYCTAQKPLAELGPVHRDCLVAGSEALTRVGSGLSVNAQLPSQSCGLFGPNLPPPKEGEEPGRPVDPDATGGYKQPVVLGFNTGAGDQLALFEQRITCDLPGVTPQLLVDYKLRYHPNQNPRIEEVEVARSSGENLRLRDGETLTVAPGERVTLTAHWADCPGSDLCGDGVCGADETRLSCSEDCAGNPPPGCTGQERYLWFNTASRKLETRRESLRLAWYARSGSYDEERTGVEEEAASGSRNAWTAPDAAGESTLWVVVRDARGGTGLIELRVSVL